MHVCSCGHVFAGVQHTTVYVTYAHKEPFFFRSSHPPCVLSFPPSLSPILVPGRVIRASLSMRRMAVSQAVAAMAWGTASCPKVCQEI